jgi:arylformamidase
MIDFEVEYNNRARVPDHEQLIAGWVNDAESYRAAAACDLDIAYGEHERQKFDFFPANGRDDAPVVIFIHGGYWQALDRVSFSHMASGVAAHGLDMAIPSYRLAPEVSVQDIIDDIRSLCLALWNAHGRKLVVTGHSAGGHLAAAMFATDWAAHGGPDGLVSAGLGISGLYDLRPLMPTAINERILIDGNISMQCSPLLWPSPRQGRFEAWVGGAESREYHRQSETLAACWGGAGMACSWHPVGDDNHYTVVRHLADGASDMTRALVDMCEPA